MDTGPFRLFSKVPYRSASDIREFVARRLYGGRIKTLSISPVEKAVPRWYVAQVKPSREKLALSHLERQGFETHCPLVARSRLIAKKHTLVNEPLFPGYVFVKFGTEQRWRSINGTIGVIKLVAFGNKPTPAPTGFVERLRGMADERGVINFEEGLKAGDAVRVVGGPLDDLCGVLASAGSSERVVVLLRLLSGETQVTLRRSQLVLA